MVADILERIERRLKVVGLTAAAAEKQAKAPDAIRNLRRAVENGDTKKGVSTRTLEKLAPVLRTTAAWLFQGVGEEGQVYVPIVGRVGANPDGSVIFATGQGTGLVAPIPPGGTSRCAALLVVGHSMRGFVDDGGLIYFDNQMTEPPPDMIATPVVAETDTGEVLVKELHHGSQPGLFDLVSLIGPVRRDVKLSWAARITAIFPPYHARQVIRPEEDLAQGLDPHAENEPSESARSA